MISSLINIFPTLFPNTRASLWNISDSLVYRDMMVLSHEMSSQSATRKNNTTHLHKNGGQIDDHYYCYCCCFFLRGRARGKERLLFLLPSKEKGKKDRLIRLQLSRMSLPQQNLLTGCLSLCLKAFKVSQYLRRAGDICMRYGLKQLEVEAHPLM